MEIEMEMEMEKVFLYKVLRSKDTHSYIRAI